MNKLLFKARGFTLIELLVVIAIIGILASIVLVSLSGARSKGRDGQRIANMQEMAKAITLVDPDTLSLTGGSCAGTGPAKASDCTGPSPVSFASYGDPSVGTSGSVCTKAATQTCQYLITGDGQTIKGNNFKICTYLESGLSVAGAAPVPGMYSVSSTTGGGVISSCPGT